MRLQKITPCLWFDTQAEEPARFYCALFPNSTIPRKSERIMVALLQMKKLDIPALKRAYDG
jgi:predicted 3-demethylubiquinone-9 3-methyltransferase (glyoxalase superfamily)